VIADIVLNETGRTLSRFLQFALLQYEKRQEQYWSACYRTYYFVNYYFVFKVRYRDLSNLPYNF